MSHFFKVYADKCEGDRILTVFVKFFTVWTAGLGTGDWVRAPKNDVRGRQILEYFPSPFY